MKRKLRLCIGEIKLYSWSGVLTLTIKTFALLCNQAKTRISSCVFEGVG